MRALLVALSLALALPASAALAEAVDDQDIVRGGCRVRTAAIDARGVATVEARCVWDVAPEALLAMLREPAQLGTVLSTLAECRRLPDGRVLQVHSVGWPLDDRQVTLDWQESVLEDGGVRFSYRRAAKQEPLAEGRVEIVEDEGHWEIRRNGNGGTQLYYASRYDAGGTLKPWVVRRFQKDGIATSMEELRAAASSGAATARAARSR